MGTGGLCGHGLVGFGLAFGQGGVGDGFREGHGGVAFGVLADGVVRAGVGLNGFKGGLLPKDGDFGVVSIGTLGVVLMRGGGFLVVVVLNNPEELKEMLVNTFNSLKGLGQKLKTTCNVK